MADYATAPGMPDVHIHNNVDANAHIFRVVGTILAIGAFCSLAWGLGQMGLLNLASALVTAFLFQFIALLLSNGIIVIPDTKSDDARIEEGKSALRALVGAGRAIIERSSILRLAMIAMVYALLFVGVRAGIEVVLGIFTNIFIAGAFGLAVGAVICAPTLFGGLFQAMKSRRAAVRTDTTTEED